MPLPARSFSSLPYPSYSWCPSSLSGGQWNRRTRLPLFRRFIGGLEPLPHSVLDERRISSSAPPSVGSRPPNASEAHRRRPRKARLASGIASGLGANFRLKRFARRLDNECLLRK